MASCKVCNTNLNKVSSKYCSNACQSWYQYQQYIEKWKLGLVDGQRGKSTKNISQHIKRYLLETFGERCSQCGWNIKHLITQRVPLEIDHIDGNAENNVVANLRLLCPNCHALSNTYRNLNKGHGRSWRTKKYLKHT